jgi:hypothetical protein
MNTEYNNPTNNRDNKEQEQGNSARIDTANNAKTNSQAPNKDKDYKVLHKDGSLADLPDQDVPGAGALDGTVGLGT